MNRFPWLALKISLTIAGMAVGLAGVAMKDRPLVWAGIGLLAGAFLSRFPERRT